MSATVPVEVVDALVIGSGPGGLMAAELLAAAGRRVTVAEAKPSAGRKFLMAGRSGLNLTHDGPPDAIAAAYGKGAGPVPAMTAAYGPRDVRAWAEALGQPVFAGSTGRVFPQAMKASPLLRAWLAALSAGGAQVRTRWRWTGLQTGDGEDRDGRGPPPRFAFDTPRGMAMLAPRVCVLALGGASWARLGSDGAWVSRLAAAGVDIAPFLPANAGLSIRWSDRMAPHLGAPVKGIALDVHPPAAQGGDARRHRGEIAISDRGLEGGGVYAVSRAVREGWSLTLDLAPDLTVATLAERLRAQPARASTANRLRRGLRMSPAKIALLQALARPLPQGDALAALLKSVPVRHDGLRPLDEAISSAGGVRWGAVDAGLMLRALPGVFVAGEMLDWEAPTGGYLITACLATGRHAGRAAAGWPPPTRSPGPAAPDAERRRPPARTGG